VGSHLGNARSAYESAEKRLSRVTEKLESIELPVQEPNLKQIIGGE
jgi:exonuclease VII small subunit